MEEKKQLNFLLAGVGGQGTILASKLIATAYMEKGYFARTAETIGMAQRGGCVVSHVRIGKDAFSPMIPKGRAGLLIGFEPSEAVRCLPFLSEDGLVVVSQSIVKPVTDALSDTSYEGGQMLAYLEENAPRVIRVDTGRICRECGSPRVANIALLGAAAAAGGFAGISAADMESVMEKGVAEKYRSVNREALKKGAAFAGAFRRG